ncbi:MAG: GrpB family protein [Fimbriimonas sp.]
MPYKSTWSGEFAFLGRRIRNAVGELGSEIHHIGSTSVPGLPAKDVVDIQLTVSDLYAPIQAPLEQAGFKRSTKLLVDHCPPGLTLNQNELAKQVYGFEGRRVHLHVRKAGQFNQRYALLCRDFLRSHPLAAAAYGEIKQQLARYFPDDVEAYYDVKDPVFDVLMAGAEEWALRVEWKSPPSDA